MKKTRFRNRASVSTNYVQTALGIGVLRLMNLIEMTFCLPRPPDVLGLQHDADPQSEH